MTREHVNLYLDRFSIRFDFKKLLLKQFNWINTFSECFFFNLQKLEPK